MWRDERKGEASNGDERLVWVSGRGSSFFGSLVSDLSHDSTTDSKFLALFSSSMSEYLPDLLSSPSWMYAKSVAHVSSPSNIWVAYTMVAALCGKHFMLCDAMRKAWQAIYNKLNLVTCSHSSLKKSRRSILVTTSRSTVISSSKSTCNCFRCFMPWHWQVWVYSNPK